MKRQDKSSDKARCSASVLSGLKTAHRALERAVRRHPWLVQGSVNVVAPKSPGGCVTYTWTRKVRAKTVTVALSRQQAAAFRQAIKVNRRVEESLSRLREMSQTAFLTNLPSVTKRRLDRSGSDGTKTVPKGA